MVDKKFIFEPDVFIMAIRYGISRTTTAPLTVINKIKDNIEFFSTGKLKIILRDCEEELEVYRNYLHQCDIDKWEEFIIYLKGEINER